MKASFYVKGTVDDKKIKSKSDLLDKLNNFVEYYSIENFDMKVEKIK